MAKPIGLEVGFAEIMFMQYKWKWPNKLKLHIQSIILFSERIWFNTFELLVWFARAEDTYNRTQASWDDSEARESYTKILSSEIERATRLNVLLQIC